MPNFRWTMEELNDISDKEFIDTILSERISDLNVYSPLAVKIKRARKWLDTI